MDVHGGSTSRIADLTICVAASNHVVDGIRQGMGNNPKSIAEFGARHARTAVVVDHPFISDVDRASIMSHYRGGKLVERWRFPMPRFLAQRRSAPSISLYPILKIADFVSDVISAIRSGQKFDLFVGSEAIDALAGIFLRRIGRVRQVVYYIMEAYPRRYSPLANSIFLRADKFCVEHSDLVWNESESIRSKRDAIWRRRFAPRQILVPSLSPPAEEDCFFARRSHRIAYLGSLDVQWGVQIAITAMREVRKTLPDAELHVIGTGSMMGTLRDLARRLGISDCVYFHGFLSDTEVKEVMKTCRAGVAPYLYKISKRGRLYFDSSKAKNYAHYGLPVVLSDAAPLPAIQLRKFNAGVVVHSDALEFAEALCLLLTNDEEYQLCLQGCRRLADTFDYETFLAGVFARSMDHLGLH